MNRMPTSEAATEGEGPNLLKRNSDDIGWEYGVLVNEVQVLQEGDGGRDL
jgi:hypothetical protein